MIPVDATEIERITDAVRVALMQVDIPSSDVIVHFESSRGVHLPKAIVIRIRVYERPFSLRRLWWWWHGQEAFDRVERRVRYVLSSLEGGGELASRALVFVSLDEAP